MFRLRATRGSFPFSGFERPAMTVSLRPLADIATCGLCVCVWGGREQGGELPEASAGLTFEYLYDTFALRRQQLVSLLITISLQRGFQLLQPGATPPWTPHTVPPDRRLCPPKHTLPQPTTAGLGAKSEEGRLCNQEKPIQTLYAKTRRLCGANRDQSELPRISARALPHADGTSPHLLATPGLC